MVSSGFLFIAGTLPRKERIFVMKITEVCGIYFSPAGTTRTVVAAAAQQAAETLGVPCRLVSLNLPGERENALDFPAETLVIVGAPTYAGRLPNKISPDLRRILHGSGTPAAAIVTYGNRAYENALAELFSLLAENGFAPVAGAACVCRHSSARALAVGRPNASDLAEVRSFAREAAERVRDASHIVSPSVHGDAESAYYVPKGTTGKPAKFLKVKPVTDPEKCTGCGRCAALCVMGSIDRENPAEVPGICIKCQACVLGCPAGAKRFDDADYLSHQKMLEQNFAEPAKPNEFFL